MADYSSQNGRGNGRPQGYNQASPDQRNAAAFSSIFGAAPPPGRSQTMTSQTPSPSGRTQTMSSMSSQASDMGRPPPLRQQQPQGYFGQAPNGYHQQGSNGYQAQTTPVQQQPQPQYLPPPVHPERRPYPPQRVDTRGGNPAAMSSSQRGYPQIPPPPALNSNSYRSQSLATSVRPTYQPANSYSMSSANAFRQQPYANRHAHTTTAQGRVVPERIDERSMSMSSFARDQQYRETQTQNGRVIPRRESIQELDGRPSLESQASTSTLVSQSQQQRSASSDAMSTRTMSMASTIAPSIAPSDRTMSMQHRPSLPSQTTGSSQAAPAKRRRGPLVDPAFLSKMADAFKSRIALTDKVKDGLVYPNAFTGTEAVDLLCYIMHSPDRNLALLLGRSLDSNTQKLFHEVTYNNRLRDSEDELYQFYDRAEVNGVFTLITECYSPTCSPDNLCYSIACPRRIDQQKRLNMKLDPGLKRAESRASLHEDRADEQKLWINSVSKEVADSVDDREKKRQEVISELCYTERDFCKDLEYLRDFWIKPLSNPDPRRPSPISQHRREKFVRTVFANVIEIYNINKQFAQALSRRQQSDPVVRNVADIFQEFIPRFGPFIQYGANQMFGKHEYERERQANPAFARFADEIERFKESRKLELNGYLTKPTTRLARYPLLLENIMKFTAEDNPDYTEIPKVIAGVRKILSQVNTESGKSENKFNLMMLSQQLVWRSGEYIDLKLTDDNRQLVFKGPLRKSPTDTTGEVTGYLFDNSLLFVRAKQVNKREELKVYKRPIPLGLLVMSSSDEYGQRLALAKRPSSSLISSRSTTSITPRSEPNKQGGYPITFKHLGKGGFEQTLYCTSQIQRQKWYEHVDAQQNTLRERANVFTKTILNEGFFSSAGMRINCCVPIDGGRKLIVGTDYGVYVTERKPKDSSVKPKRVLDVKNVTQIDVLEQHAILLVLYDKNLYSYAIEALDPEESQMAPSKRGRKISHATIFKIGVFDGQHLVCAVKPPSNLNNSTDIKIYKPDSMPNSKKKSGLAKMLAGGQEVLKPHKEFYIPTETFSVHFLRSSLCVGCARGFEIVTMDTLQTQPLLDQADTSLDFVAQKENLKPLHVERINRDFLLCYSDFAFFVNRHGWRAFPEWKISWEGTPQSFAVFQPYILAFEPSFIEMRHLDTGLLVCILTAKNVRMLHSSTREILYAYEDEMGNDVIASLDFWGKPQDGAGSSRGGGSVLSGNS